ncbi:MAG: cation:proton antiporter [Thaumarchaeota archaeon]|nr:cation:proton antiporter [Nitrososphaerota archaeon]
MAVAGVELVLTAFVVLMLIAQLLSIKARVPYTLVLVFLGIGATALVSLPSLGSNIISDGLRDTITQMGSLYGGLVQGGLFVGLIVPPLIFEAMMHIRSGDLRAVIGPSIILATVGVVIATLVGGVLLWQVAGLSPTVSFLFAAIIAPTDVVTVLEVFRRSKVPPRLGALMDTEAAFNDATAIIVFSIVVSSIGLPRVPILSTVSSFGLTTLGGAAIGFLVAFGAERVSGIVDDALAKITLTIVAVYGSYVFATGLGLSGLIAVAVAGLYFGNVTMNASVGQETRTAILTFWNMAAFIGNSVAFLLIGFETNLTALAQSAGLILAAYLGVTLARAASVYPILAIIGQVRNRIPISWSNTAMLGGVRGALSIALAASLGASTVVSAADVHTITTMVLGVAFLSIVIQAPLLSSYVRRKFADQATLT